MSKYIFCVMSFFLISCTDLQEHNKQNLKKVAKEMEMREFKKITENEMITWVNEEGQKITKQLKKQLEKDIENHTDSPEKILIAYKSPILDSLKKVYSLEIKKITFQTSNPKILYHTEQEILDAYLYSLEKKEELFENYQKLHKETPTKFLFTSPIKINNKYVGMWSLVFPKSSVIKNM